MPNTQDSRSLRTLFERKHRQQDIESGSQSLLCQMGKLAECIYLLVSCAPWSEQRLHSLLMNDQIACIKSTVGDTGDDWKSSWVEVFWPELSSNASSGMIRSSPDAPKTGMRTSTAEQLPDGEGVSKRSGFAQTGNGGAAASGNTNAGKKTGDVITALEVDVSESSSSFSRRLGTKGKRRMGRSRPMSLGA